MSDYLDMLNEAMDKQSSAQLLTLMSVMTQFFDKVPMETLVMGKSIVLRSLHLISFNGDRAVEVHSALGKFLMVD